MGGRHLSRPCCGACLCPHPLTYAPCAPHVALVVVGPRLADLWRQVVRGSDDRLGACRGRGVGRSPLCPTPTPHRRLTLHRVLEHARDAKVPKPDLVVGREEHVCLRRKQGARWRRGCAARSLPAHPPHQLEVAVEDLALVNVEQAEAELDEPVADLRLGDGLALAPLLQRAQVARLAELGHDAEKVAIVKSFDVAQDARVLEVSEYCVERKSALCSFASLAARRTLVFAVPLRTGTLPLGDTALVRLHALDVDLLDNNAITRGDLATQKRSSK